MPLLLLLAYVYNKSWLLLHNIILQSVSGVSIINNLSAEYEWKNPWLAEASAAERLLLLRLPPRRSIDTHQPLGWDGDLSR